MGSCSVKATLIYRNRLQKYYKKVVLNRGRGESGYRYTCYTWDLSAPRWLYEREDVFGAGKRRDHAPISDLRVKGLGLGRRGSHPHGGKWRGRGRAWPLQSQLWPTEEHITAIAAGLREGCCVEKKDCVLALGCGRQETHRFSCLSSLGKGRFKSAVGGHLSSIFWVRGTLGAPSLGQVDSDVLRRGRLHPQSTW